uniref:DUF378 domain-containing protein n=1 Tax=viral metagenome TaxID=1070528 RepID=A0A6C0KHZ6_9ZZZZ
MNLTNVIFTLMLLITILGSVNWGLVPSGNNLVERWIPKRMINYAYYVFAFTGLLTLILFIRLKSNDDEIAHENQK